MIINILTGKKETAKILNYIVSKLKISKSGLGIAYTTNVSCMGYDDNKEANVWNTITSEEDEGMFKKLTVIVNRSMADDVMDIAREFGAKGGTILHGCGTEAGCVAKLFGMEIEPEKELIIILLPTAITNTVTEALFHRLNLDIPGQGMLFVESVSDVKGIVEVTGDK